MMNKFDELVEAIKQRGIQETAYENMKLTKENKDLQQRIDKAIEYIEIHKRKDEFLELNEWGTRELLEILGGKE